MARKKLVTETARHVEAFAFYAKLGSKRSTDAVAKEFKVKHETVMLWSWSFNWQDRLKEMDRKAADELERKLEKEYFEDKTRLKKMKLKLFAILEKEVNSANLDAADVDRILKIVKTELGEATSITHGKQTVDTVNPLFGILSEQYNEDTTEIHKEKGVRKKKK